MGKVLVIGLDGAALPLIERWAKAGELPFFAEMMECGGWGFLQSTPNFGSASAWPSFYTGLNPGRHRMFDFLYREAGSYRLRWLTRRRYIGIPFWKTASDQGLNSTLVTLPATYPVEPFNGIAVADWMTPKTASPGFTHPPGLWRELRQTLGKHIFAPSVKAEVARKDYRKAGQSLKLYNEYKLQLCLYLMEKYPADIFCCAWISPDQAGHYLWHLIDPQHPQYDPGLAGKFGNIFLQVYKSCDRAMAELHRSFGGYLIIMSDHGHERNPLGEPHLKSLLQQTGLLKMKSGNDKRASAFSRLVSRTFDALQVLLGRQIKRFLIANFPNLLDFALTRQNLADVDWNRTSVYLCPEPTVNLKGREPQGIIPPEERENLLKQVEEILYSARDTRSGEKAVEKVFRREQVYWGTFAEEAPDLLVVWNRNIVAEQLKLEYQGRTICTEAHYRDLRSGNHSPQGIFFLRGEGVKPGYRSDNSRIYDLCPTILHLANCSLPQGLDGRFLNEFFSDDFLKSRPPRYHQTEVDTEKTVPDYSTIEERESAQKRLKDLGYL